MTEMRVWRSVLLFFAAAVGIYVFVQIWGVCVPFILGVAIAYLIHPLVDRFVAMGLRRDRTVVVLYALLLGVVATMGAILLPRLYHEINIALQELPAYTAAFDGMIIRSNETIRAILKDLLGSRAPAFALPFRAQGVLESMFHSLPENIVGFAHFGLWIFIIPFVCFFTLAQGREWIDRLFDYTPSEHVESLLGFMAQINATLGGYVRGQILESICVGLITMTGLGILGVDGAILLGVVTGILNVVPFLAPIVGGTFALLAGYFQGLPMASLTAVFVFFVVVRLIDDFVLIPFIVGNSVKLHPVAMLLAVLTGFELGGLLGLVFAVPLAAVIKVVLEAVLRGRRENLLIADRHVIS